MAVVIISNSDIALAERLLGLTNEEPYCHLLFLEAAGSGEDEDLVVVIFFVSILVVVFLVSCCLLPNNLPLVLHKSIERF